jgi:hypothetical protein
MFKHCVEGHIHLDAEVRLSLNYLLPYQPHLKQMPLTSVSALNSHLSSTVRLA